MARKAIKRLRENKKDEEAENYAGPALTPETRRGIGVILLFALGILSVFSLFNLAGSVGQFIETILRQTFGWAAYVIPVIFLWWGYLLLRAVEKPLSITTYVGFGLSVVSITALFHIFIPFDEAISSISAGRGGGYLGFIFSYPFQRIMGFWAALVLVVALFCIAILILFNTSLERLAEHRGALGQMAEKLRNGLRWFKRETDDTEGEIEAAEEVMEPDEEESDDEEKEVFKHNPVADSEHGDDEPAAKDNAPARRRKKIDIPLDLLEKKMAQPTSGDIGGNTEKIRKTLGNFGVHVEMGDVRVGPTVTQYTFRPAEGVKLSQITGLGNDLALALAAHPIRIEAPIPGKSLVGVEVPNHKIAPVGLRGILESPEFKKRTGNLTVGLGRDVAGNVVLANLESMPHLLIAGATGSGKSVGIHNLIISMLYQNSPDMLRFILVDPKKVELTSYSGIPHLMTPVITEVAKIVNALRWCIAEMDRRYQLLSEHNKKNITLYNGSVLVNKLPYIVVIIDELADLMSQAAQEVEAMIIRLAQMARAVGIHLVVSTQRPSVDVITGLIKANITTRIAFSVASQMDSRTILDYAGAEKLLGKGDMLFISSELSKPRRIQGALVTETEIERVASYLKQDSEPDYVEEVIEKQTSVNGNGYDNLGDDDDLLDSAKEVIWQANKASASLLQRRLRIGYARAARLLDLLEEEGIIGPGEGAKPREILLARPDIGETEENEEEEEVNESDEEREV